jgi:hypothetical protein
MTFDRLPGRAGKVGRNCRCLCLRMCVGLFCGGRWEGNHGACRNSFGRPLRGSHRRQSQRPFRLRFGRHRNTRCSAVWHTLPNQFGDGIGTAFEKPSGPWEERSPSLILARMRTRSMAAGVHSTSPPRNDTSLSKALEYLIQRVGKRGIRHISLVPV